MNLRPTISLLIALLALPGIENAFAQEPAPPPAEPGWALQRLMQYRALVQHADVAFTERRYLSVLDTPLELSGRLTYQAPDRLAKHTLEPVAESFFIEGGAVRIEKPGKPAQELSIDDHPLLYALAISLRATLAGDRVTLEKWYAIDFSGTRDDWRMQLTPREDSWRDYLRDIVIRGKGEQLREIALNEQSGDRGVILIAPES